jgi:NADH:ubiquinone oxidoreductase subunit 6 (subunit J)
MDKIKKNLNVIGLGLAFAGLAALRIWPQTKIAGLVLVVVGVGAIAAYLGLNAGQLKQGMKRRSFLYSSNAILLVALVLGILVLVNVFFSRHHHRFDFTESKLHSLSDPSIKVAAALKTDISVKAFFREGNPARGRMEDLL